MSSPVREALGRSARPLALALGSSLLCGTAAPACSRKVDVSLSVLLPQSVEASAQWIEVGVFDGPCPNAEQLAGGLPATGTIARLAFGRSSSTAPPALGALSAKSYAFAAVARGTDCGVLATGCTIEDVASSRSVAIPLNATADGSRGVCASGTVCSLSRCVPIYDENDPSFGAHCSLELIGSGPLQNSLSEAAVMSVPAVAATPSGFLIAYREFDPVQGASRLTTLPITTSGGASTAKATVLPDRCSSMIEDDAVGLVFGSDSGVVALARPSCGDTKPAGLELYSVDATGGIGTFGFTPATSALKVRLSASHALALAPTGHLLAFVVDGRARVSAVNQDLRLQRGVDVGGPSDATDVWLAASGQVLAVLTATTQGPPAVSDAGAEGADPFVDDGSVTAALALQVAPGGSLAALSAPTYLPGNTASIAALSTRVFVAASGLDGQAVASQFFDYDANNRAATPGTSDFVTSSTLGEVLGVAVTTRGDRLFFAMEQPDAIGIIAYEHASTSPVRLREVGLANLTRVSSVRGVRDGRIAIAASDTRVAVVWMTARTLATNDVPGGYAVFACATP